MEGSQAGRGTKAMPASSELLRRPGAQVAGLPDLDVAPTLGLFRTDCTVRWKSRYPAVSVCYCPRRTP